MKEFCFAPKNDLEREIIWSLMIKKYPLIEGRPTEKREYIGVIGAPSTTFHTLDNAYRWEVELSFQEARERL